jgi:polar amino acid transport system substrate-binding protein
MSCRHCTAPIRLAIHARLDREGGGGRSDVPVVVRRARHPDGYGETTCLVARSHRCRSPLLFTFELALGRGDDDFRLAVDRALSRIYRSGEIGGLCTDVFGEPDENALAFFRWNALPD